MQAKSGHKSYILRVWQVERDAQPAMAAVLEDCETSARQAFPSLAALVEFLETGKALAQPAIPDLQSEEWS